MKNYIVKLEGNIFRPIKIRCVGYKEALKTYNELKEEFMNTETIISMNRIEVVDGEEILYTMYDKPLKKEENFDYYVNMIDEALKGLTKLKQETYSKLSEQDKTMPDFYHALECVDTEELSEEEMKAFFKNAEIVLAKRRLVKFDFDLNNAAYSHLNKIKCSFGHLKAAKVNSEKNKEKKQKKWNSKIETDNPYLDIFKDRNKTEKAI